METHLRFIKRYRFPQTANDVSDPPANSNRRAHEDDHSHFEIYQTDCVNFTSTLFGGGDWHWRLISPEGIVLVDCGGYRNQGDCMTAVDMLRSEASSATIQSQ